MQTLNFARLFLAWVCFQGFGAGVWARPVYSEPVDHPVWYSRHESFLREAQERMISLLFLGDSITDFWRAEGRGVWANSFSARSAGNFGISGDRVGNLLWRLQHGELARVSARVIVLLIGTNDLAYSSVDEIFDGYRRLVREIRERAPRSRLILLGILPRVEDPSHGFRSKTQQLNPRIRGLADGQHVHYLDFGARLLAPGGEVSRDLLPDGLHLSARGYEIWANEIEPLLARLWNMTP